ncbi:MAG: hypothetical protein JWM05_886 [Acidimicrobiales bacterium]|nr:hypothetical protein [Acidimicrobiales bacterium]
MTSEPARSGPDPRRVVVAGTVAAVGVIAALTSLLLGPVDRARATVTHVRVATAVPMRHLDGALDAHSSASKLLVRAAASTAVDRSKLLELAIAAGNASTKAWTGYRATRLPLAGEPDLAARYERDLATSATIGGQVMVPIIRSNAPGILPERVLIAEDNTERDLIALRDLYERHDIAALHSLDGQVAALGHRVRIGAVLLALAMVIGGGVALRSAFRVAVSRRARADAADLAKFESRLVRGLELAHEERPAIEVATKASAEVLPEAIVAVVVADASHASLRPVVGRASCGVSDPDLCPAIAAGAPLQFLDSTALDACPVLAKGSPTPCSVTCMPVSIAGRDDAILQLTGPAGVAPEMTPAVRLIVRRVGERVTMLRALARFEIQASRDPLTGLDNRRSLQARVEQLDATDTAYSVAFADLDHFKRLNDVHGHEAGDRALRAFARTLTNSLRPEDIACRWGGEEFVILLPGCDQERAAQAMDRVRVALALDVDEGHNAAVTVSVGVAEGDRGAPFAETVARADAALRTAKASGRDQVVVARPPAREAAIPAPQGSRTPSRAH